MKICSVQAMLAIAFCSLAFAHNNYGQILDKKITIKLKNVSLEEALVAIEQLADVRFFYSVDQLAVEESVTLEAIDQALGDLLHDLLTPHRIKFNVHERDATITLKKEADDVDTRKRKIEHGNVVVAPPPFLRVTVTGTVTDAVTQQPMAGVNVLEKGTTNGTVSDGDGRYAITVQDGAMLVFSFIGYEMQEIGVANVSTIDIALVEEVSTLQEVTVNAGYWQVSKREATGNISKVDAEEIANQPVFNSMAAIQGRMPGVYITEDSGVPGSGFRIQIRGRNSLRSDANDPLYVINGVPFDPNSMFQNNPNQILAKPSPLSLINPQDIESIEVLKDADATAIYGSRGANGVVLITTRKARLSETTVDLNFYSGVGKVTRKMDLLNTGQYLEIRNEAFLNDGRTPAASDYDVNGTWDQNRYTDWQEVLFGGTAQFNNVQASISGGSAHTKFLFSGSYNRQTTVFPGDMYYERGSGHFNLDHGSHNNKLHMNLSSTVSVEGNNLGFIDYFDRVYTLPPNAPALYDENGNLNWENGTWENPLADLERDYTARTTNIISSLLVTYELIRHLTLKSSFGYNAQFTNERNLYPIRAQSPATPKTGFAGFSRGINNSWILEPQLNYRRKVGAGTLSVLLGGTFQDSQRDRNSISISGITNDELLESIAAAPSDQVTARNDFSQYRYMAFFGRINYDWREKYIVNLTGRRDGSSRFGPGKRFSDFGAVGAAWIFTEENFMRGRTLFSFGKIRGSYGTTGSDQIGNYGYFDSYSTPEVPVLYENGIALHPSRLANDQYAWESNTKLEAAIELGFLNDRIYLSTSYYRNRSSNQLVGLPLPGTAGFSSVQYNLDATVQNTGVEVELNSTNISTDHFTWRTQFNVTRSRNELVAYPDLESSSYASTLRVGEPLSVIIAYDYEYVDPETGLYQFRDLDESGGLSTADRLKAIVGGVKYYGGIQNSLSYKGFELSFLFQFVKGLGASYRNRFPTPGFKGAQPVEVLDRWQQSGDDTRIQKVTQRASTVNTAHTRWKQSDENLEDKSFVRMKNISLSWRLPKLWTQKLSMSSGSIFLQGRNLLTLTNFKGLDPESSLGVIKMFTAGIQLGF